jgi:hypothetical protein
LLFSGFLFPSSSYELVNESSEMVSGLLSSDGFFSKDVINPSSFSYFLSLSIVSNLLPLILFLLFSSLLSFVVFFFFGVSLR